MEADDPGGPDEGFKLPEPEDDDWDREPRVAAGFSTWADSEGSRKKEVVSYTGNVSQILFLPMLQFFSEDTVYSLVWLRKVANCHTNISAIMG